MAARGGMQKDMVQGTREGASFQDSVGQRHVLDRIFQVLVVIATSVGLVVLAVLLVDIAVDGVPRLSWDFLTSLSSINPATTGIYAALIGSLWLLAITTLVSVPLGIGAAVYLEEYATDTWINRLIEVNISNLAGVPSIIYGLLGVGVFVNGISIFGLGQTPGMGTIVLAGALTLSLLILPVIIIATREAFRTIPNSVREGGYALGATRWEVIRGHLLPMAIPGALTGTILALSRAIGETAPLIVVGAATFATFAADSPFSSYSALPIQIYDFVARPQPEFRTAAAAGIVVLMIVLLLTNSIAIYLRNKYQRRA